LYGEATRALGVQDDPKWDLEKEMAGKKGMPSIDEPYYAVYEFEEKDGNAEVEYTPETQTTLEVFFFWLKHHIAQVAPEQGIDKTMKLALRFQDKVMESPAEFVPFNEDDAEWEETVDYGY